VAYRFDDGEETSLAVESKGGRSGFNHLWKLLGLKTHLEIQHGVLLADDSEPLHGRRSRSRAVTTSRRKPSPDDLAGELVDAGLIATEPDPAVLLAWRRCFRVEDARAGASVVDVDRQPVNPSTGAGVEHRGRRRKRAPSH